MSLYFLFYIIIALGIYVVSIILDRMGWDGFREFYPAKGVYVFQHMDLIMSSIFWPIFLFFWILYEGCCLYKRILTPDRK